MDTSGINNKLGRLHYYLDMFRYNRKRNLNFALLGIVIMVCAASGLLFIQQKKEIAKKEEIVQDYLAEIADAREKKDTSTETAFPESSSGGLPEDPSDDFSAEAESAAGPGLNEDSSSQSEALLNIYICGSVLNPGVFQVERGARISDVLEACGGGSEDACLEAVNLAEPVTDGQRIYIPSTVEIKNADIPLFDEDLLNNGISGSSGLHEGKEHKNQQDNSLIDINTAAAAELELLPGIGPQLAQNIIGYREKNGSFNTIEELKDVKGIGEKKYEDIKALIKV